MVGRLVVTGEGRGVVVVVVLVVVVVGGSVHTGLIWVDWKMKCSPDLQDSDHRVSKLW